MDNHVCPFLGTLDETYKRGPHVDYPSFENRCLAVDEYGEDEACVVMLSDQATFCLSSGHALCPRYQAAQEAATTKESRRRPRGRASAPAGRAAGLTSDWLQSSLDELDQDLDDGDDSPLKTIAPVRRKPVDADLLAAFRANGDYRSAIALLGYPD